MVDLRQTGRRDLKMTAGLDVEPLFEDPDADRLPVEDGVIDLYFAASHLSDVVPNPWRAAGLAKDVFDALLEKHPQDSVRANYLFVLEELRKELSLQRDRLCQEAFRQLLASGEMRFIVVAKDLGFNKLPTKIDAAMTRQANREDGKPYQASLFSEMDESELNGLEVKVATYLDKQARLFFWYRNRARRDYFVQGWKPGRIYADFIMTLKPDDLEANDEYHQVFVVETKGLHLKAPKTRTTSARSSTSATTTRRRRIGRSSCRRCSARRCASRSWTRRSGNESWGTCWRRERNRYSRFPTLN